MDQDKINYYQKRINEIGQWYQPIEFIKGKLETKNSKYDSASTIHGINKWNLILRRNLPENLKGKKILDIGCASGLYSMMCARSGAEVIGLELDEEGYKQSLLAREIFSELDGVDYSRNFRILKMDLMDFDWEKYPRFDVVLALNVLYWITMSFEKIALADRKEYDAGQLEDLVKKIRNHSDKVLVQADENKYWVRKNKSASVEATNSKSVVALLKKCGYKNIKVDKPIILGSIWRTFVKHKPEVDFKRPIFYARPVITAES